MALELLDGPRLLTLPDGSPAGFSSSKNRYTWLDQYGIVGFLNAATASIGSSWGVAHLNGSCFVRNDRPSGSFAGPIAQDYRTDWLIWRDGIGTTHLWTFDALTGNWVEKLEAVPWLNAWTRLPDRWLNVIGTNVQYIPFGDVESNAVTEYTVSPDPAAGLGDSISKGRGNVVFVGYDNGEIVEYDWLARTEVGQRRTIGLANKGIWYSPRWDVFISLHDAGGNQDEVRVWANEQVVNQLTAPIALDPIRQGAISRVQVTLTDAEGEGMPGRRVDWSVISGDGSMLDAQSVTDDSGNAEARYRAPLTLTLGTVNIQASVTY